MKKVQSIGFKLVVGGVIAVLIPLLIVLSVSTTKSSKALTDLSKNQVESVAMDLARLTNQILSAEILLAGTFAEKNQVIQVATLKEQGNEAELALAVSNLYKNLQSTYKKIGGGYVGFFVTDPKGNIITGVREKGEYPSLNVADRDYFKTMVNTKAASIGDIVRSKVDGLLVSVICAPVTADTGSFIGSFCLEVKADLLTESISSRKIGTTGYGFMTNKQGTIMAHPVKKHILSLNMFELKGLEIFSKEMVSDNTGVEAYNFNGVDKISGYAPVGLNNWYVAATQDTQEFMASVHSIRNITLVVGAVCLALTITAVLLLSRAIVRPLNAAVAGLKDIAQGEGNLTMRLPVTSRDEIGELAAWFNTFIEKLQSIIQQVGANAQQVDQSSGELSNVAAQISSNSKNTADRSNSVAAAAEEMSANLNSVAAAMEQSSTNTNMVAAAAEEMSSTINEIARNAEQAREISLKAVANSTGASARMSELGKSAKAIGRVTETITEISEQTNLLALNATIEAARAGEAGKGFAVVATEIKELAVQTARATLDIQSQIEAVQNSTTASIREIDEISTTINSINEIVATIAAAVEEQSTATMEISSNINQASQGIQDVNENISQSSAVALEVTTNIARANTDVEELAKGSEQIRLNAEDLNRMSAELTGIVQKFKV